MSHWGAAPHSKTDRMRSWHLDVGPFRISVLFDHIMHRGKYCVTMQGHIETTPLQAQTTGAAQEEAERVVIGAMEEIVKAHKHHA